jgi:hypothetical protein
MNEMIRIQRSKAERTFHGNGGGFDGRKLLNSFERFAEDLGHSTRSGNNGKTGQK